MEVRGHLLTLLVQEKGKSHNEYHESYLCLYPLATLAAINARNDGFRYHLINSQPLDMDAYDALRSIYPEF